MNDVGVTVVVYEFTVPLFDTVVNPHLRFLSCIDVIFA